MACYLLKLNQRASQFKRLLKEPEDSRPSSASAGLEHLTYDIRDLLGSQLIFITLALASQFLYPEECQHAMIKVQHKTNKSQVLVLALYDPVMFF